MDESTLNSAAAVFGCDAGASSEVRGGNFSRVYALPHALGPSILRLTPPNAEIDEGWLEATLAFMDHLARAGVSVPAPRRSLNGRLVESIPAAQGVYHVTCFERAPGVLAEELPFSVWDAGLYQTLGRAVGAFHAAARTYLPQPGMERPHWDQAGNCFNPAESIADARLAQRRAEALAAVQALPRDSLAYGLIHTDLHGGNFMLDVEDGRVTLLDFDDCAYGWYAMDIAMCLHDFCVLTPQPDKDAFAAQFLLNFLRGYLAAYPLEPIWIERLPLFLKLVETGIYAQVAEFAPSESPESWVGRFMQGRVERIARGAPVVEIDFAQIAAQAAQTLDKTARRTPARRPKTGRKIAPFWW